MMRVTSELLGTGKATTGARSPMCTVERTQLQRDGQPIDLLTLRNAWGMQVRFLTLGGIIVSIKVPDKHGNLADVVLGYDDLESYLHDECYFGALIGRSANRIAGGAFELDGQSVQLSRNDGSNHLHGGERGFNSVVWTAEPFERADECGATLSYSSAAGEEGYPGTLRARVTYTLKAAGDFVVEYHAETDSATPVNLTQHAYFNLTGLGDRDVLGHLLQVNATHFTPVGSGLIPTGEVRSVDGTPFDFTSAHPIGERIGTPDHQLQLGGGYDHNFVLSGAPSAIPTAAAHLYEPESGRVLDILTTEPGLQVCSGNALHIGVRGRSGQPLGEYAGVALETQHFPDAPNHPGFPTTILQSGQHYQSQTIYRFSLTAP